MTTAKEIKELMYKMKNKQQCIILSRFFKTGKGQYGEGDCFLGIKVPQTRLIVKQYKLQIPLPEIKKLLDSPWHEIRLCGFLLLVEEMKAVLPKRKVPQNNEKKRMDARRRKEIANFYLQNATQANNWDLVDLSCGTILGGWMLHPLENGDMPSRTILDSLATSHNLWEQRIAIVSTILLIKHQQYEDTLRIASLLLSHPHDLIHKATGWMLREVGKQDIKTLRAFLAQHVTEMPRTTLRYAIEKMTDEERLYWMKL